MRMLKKIIRFAVKLTGWAFSLVCAAIVLLLAGYWLGWKSVTERHTLVEVAKVTTNSAGTARAVATTNAVADVRPHVETAQERMVRLAKTLVSSTDERDATLTVDAEIASLNLDEVYASLAALQSAPSTATFNQLRMRLIGRMAILSPYAALDFARREYNSGNASGGAFVGEVLQRWAYSDPAAALRAWRDFTTSGAAMDQISIMNNNEYGLVNIVRQLALKDLNVALSEVANLPAFVQEGAWLSLSTMATKEGPRNQLLAAISALPPGESRTRAMAQTVEMWARSPGQRDAALQWLDATKFSSEDQFRIDQRLSRWIADDARGAADWMLSRANSPEDRSQRMESSVSNWAYEDPVAAGQWLKAQGVNNDSARAMAIYARTVVVQHPEMAMEWVRQIPDEGLRQRTFSFVEKQVRMRFPNRADELLAGGK